MKKRVLVVGIDQAIPKLIDKYMDEGLLPNLKKLAENGVKTKAYSCPPCDTPTNWTTIATGATTGNHGCTSFYPHAIGEDYETGLKYRSRSMLSRFCQAEYIWDALDREGLTSFIINYPAGWPGNLRNGVISTFTWNIPESSSRIFQKGKKRKVNSNSVMDETVLQQLNSSKIPVKIQTSVRKSLEEQTFYILGEDKYDKLAIIEQNEDKNSVKYYEINKWSDFLSTKVSVKKGEKNEIINVLYKNQAIRSIR
jgi:predicted AlkP superfamily phosphohydrolase/phosphomutase